MTICPCGSAEALDACCGRYIDGEAAPTAVALMRSRYSAFALGRGEYLQATLSSDQRADFDVAEFDAAAGQTKWQGLEIRDISDGGEDDETGAVEFVARYRERGQSIAHHERAMFKREEGRWVFADCVMNPKGATVTAEKVGRNAPCPCGSGKKYKKCCGQAA
jgi:SEC-C motif-containing protein